MKSLVQKILRQKISGVFTGIPIVLDNLTIRDSKVIDCQLWYGGGPVRVIDSDLIGCSVHFYGAAAATVEFMRNFEGNENSLIEDTFRKSFWLARSS